MINLATILCLGNWRVISLLMSLYDSRLGVRDRVVSDRIGTGQSEQSCDNLNEQFD